MRLKEKILRFMYGRYGFGYGAADKLNYFLIGSYFFLIILSFILSIFGVPKAVSTVIYILGYAVMIWLFFRMFSKNIAARQAENRRFLKIWNAVSGEFRYFGRKVKEIKTNRFRRCPSCHAQLRLPIKRGTHTVVCPACRRRFDVHILF